MRIPTFMGAALLGAIIPAASANAAMLMGDHMRVNWALPNANTRYSGFTIGGTSLYSFYVGKGVEGTANLNPGGQFSIDFADKALTLTFLTNITFAGHAFNGLVFEELDGGLFPTLGTVEGLASSMVTAGTSKLLINLRGLRYNAGDKVVLNFVPEVPEPATWAMMIAGFAVVGSAMRRRPRTSIAFS